MSILDSLRTHFESFDRLCPSGFTLGFHIKFTTPEFLFQTYPREWTDRYSAEGLVMKDPVIAWAFENSGVIRWSDVNDADFAGVLRDAADHGLKYGATAVVDSQGSRTMSGFAHDSREFTDEELSGFADAVAELHDITLVEGKMSKEARDNLRRLSQRFNATGSL